jgi:3-isopropylmalate dehydrogenase
VKSFSLINEGKIMTYKLTLLPGDGIGKEVTASAIKVLSHIAPKFNLSFTSEEKLIGGVSYNKFGVPLTDETLKSCYNSDAVILGAVGGYEWENIDHKLKPEAALLKLRKSLELFANIRPAKVYSSLISSSPLKKEVLEGTDFVVIRELTSGVYFGEPRGYNENEGWNTMRYSREEISRIARIAFDTASRRKNKVTSVDKANVLEVSQFWRKIVAEVHNEYPDVELQNMYVDNAAMQIVKNPKQFDVILTSNLFGDILSDIAGIITGSLGMLPSASLGQKYALYEPIHGSAPDIAGKNIANPIGAIESIAMMYNFTFKLPDAAKLIETSIERTLQKGYRTTDIKTEGCNILSTTEMTDKIINSIDEILREKN